MAPVLLDLAPWQITEAKKEKANQNLRIFFVSK